MPEIIAAETERGGQRDRRERGRTFEVSEAREGELLAERESERRMSENFMCGDRELDVC